MKLMIGAAAFGLAVLAHAPAMASDLLFQFDQDASYVQVTENSRACLPFSGCKLSASLLTLDDFSLDLGDSFTFDFAKFKVSAGWGGDDNAQVDAALAFLSPVAQSASNDATISYLRLGGFFTQGAVGGSVIWNQPSQQIEASDGSLFTVAFNDLSGVTFGNSAFASVTITLDRVGLPADQTLGVPEPASWAMMLTGFGLVGGAMRARRRTSVRFA